MPSPTAQAAPRVRVLPPHVAGQIAAGEVVERPASVIKELLENALDAGSAKILIELERGGADLIRVTDDGRGMPAEDLVLALAPHATSKVREIGDLDRIATLGFRGEALASIASVSRLTIRSRERGATGSWQIELAGVPGDPADPSHRPIPAAGPVGTSVTVRDLFFNTPARRKFLRTTPTEQARCLDAVRDLAMAHPAVGFTARVDGRVALELPSGQDPFERVLALLGPELKGQLLTVSVDGLHDARGLALWGVVGVPAIARATNRSQHVFVNGRCVRDRTIQHALGEAYRGLLEPSRYPTAVLMLEMSPEGVDVNVHPSKSEVRFRDGGMVHALVHRAVHEALRKADLTPTLEDVRPQMIAPAGQPRAVLPSQTLTRWTTSGAEPPTRLENVLSESASVLADALRDGPVVIARPEPIDADDGEAQAGPILEYLQVHDSYVVAQDPRGILLIDQHALHERVMFETLLRRVEAGPLERQRLLAPVVVRATAPQIAMLEEVGPLLEKLGIEAIVSGPGAIAVRTFPTLLFERRVDPAVFMEDFFDRAAALGPRGRQDQEAVLRDVLDMMACKAAVKAGDKLGDAELRALLAQRDAVERSSSCPHGRPTSVVITLRELEKLFARS